MGFLFVAFAPFCGKFNLRIYTHWHFTLLRLAFSTAAILEHRDSGAVS